MLHTHTHLQQAQEKVKRERDLPLLPSVSTSPQPSAGSVTEELKQRQEKSQRTIEDLHYEVLLAKMAQQVGGHSGREFRNQRRAMNQRGVVELPPYHMRINLSSKIGLVLSMCCATTLQLSRWTPQYGMVFPEVTTEKNKNKKWVGHCARGNQRGVPPEQRVIAGCILRPSRPCLDDVCYAKVVWSTESVSTELLKATCTPSTDTILKEQMDWFARPTISLHFLLSLSSHTIEMFVSQKKSRDLGRRT